MVSSIKNKCPKLLSDQKGYADLVLRICHNQLVYQALGGGEGGGWGNVLSFWRLALFIVW